MEWLSKARAWLMGSSDRRDGARFAPLMTAHYWSGQQSKLYRVRDISPSGVFVETEDLWGEGTYLQLRVKEKAATEETSALAVVARRTVDGMGMSFVFADMKEKQQFEKYLSGVHRSRRSEAGNSLIEFALLLPLLLLVVVNAVNFGGFFYAWITMANASRSASQYASLAGASVSAPSPVAAAQIYNVVTQDISSLRNQASLAVRVCTNNNGPISCSQTGTGSFTNPPADVRPEASLYVMTWVDVLYTYQPLIPLFNFPQLGVHATLPATRIHRQTVMRRLQ